MEGYVYQGIGSPVRETAMRRSELLKCPLVTANRTGVIIAVEMARSGFQTKPGVQRLIGANSTCIFVVVIVDFWSAD